MTLAPSETPPSAEPLEEPVRRHVLRAPIPMAARVIDFGRPLTAEEFMRIPEAEGKQELVDGRVIEMPPVGMGHGKKQLGIGRRLGDWNDQHKLGEVMVETGYILDRKPDVTRGPDVSFIRTEKIPESQDEDDFIEAVPDFVVEVRSKNDQPHELTGKAEEYLAFGVPLVVVVDRKRAIVEVHRPNMDVVTLNSGDTFDGGDVLPGLSMPVAEMLA